MPFQKLRLELKREECRHKGHDWQVPERVPVEAVEMWSVACNRCTFGTVGSEEYLRILGVKPWK